MKRDFSNIVVLMLFAFAALVDSGRAYADDETAHIEDARPLARAIEKLESVYRIPIWYEDTRYLSSSDHAYSQTGNVGEMTRREVSLTYQVPEKDAPLDVRKELAGKALGAVVQNYNSTRGAEVFSVRATESGFDVRGAQTDSSGNIASGPLLLDTRITIPPATRSVHDLVRLIAAAVTEKTGVKVQGGNEPTPLLSQQKTDVGANNEPARSVLASVLASVPVGYLGAHKAGEWSMSDVTPTTVSFAFNCTIPSETVECAITSHVVGPYQAPTIGMGKPDVPIKQDEEAPRRHLPSGQ